MAPVFYLIMSPVPRRLFFVAMALLWALVAALSRGPVFDYSSFSSGAALGLLEAAFASLAASFAGWLLFSVLFLGVLALRAGLAGESVKARLSRPFGDLGLLDWLCGLGLFFLASWLFTGPGGM